MNEQYESPILEIIKFDKGDIINSSNETPDVPFE